MTTDLAAGEMPIKAYLRERRIKVLWLAKELGCTPPTVSQIINGWANEATVRRWAPRIAKVLGVDVAVVFPELGGGD